MGWLTSPTRLDGTAKASTVFSNGLSQLIIQNSVDAATTAIGPPDWGDASYSARMGGQAVYGTALARAVSVGSQQPPGKGNAGIIVW